MTTQQTPPSDAATVAKFAKLTDFKIARDVREPVATAQKQYDRAWEHMRALSEKGIKTVRAAEKSELWKAIESGAPFPPIPRSENDIRSGIETTIDHVKEIVTAMDNELLPLARRTVQEFCDSLEKVSKTLEADERRAAVKFDAVFEPSLTLLTMKHLVAVLPARVPEKCVGPGSPKNLFLGLL